MLFSFLKKIFSKEDNLKYSVGYFTLSVPEPIVVDILRLLYRSKMESLPHSSTFEILMDLAYHNISDENFISDRFFQFSDIVDADVAMDNLNTILFSENGMYPFVTKKLVKERRAFSKEGEVHICIVVATKNLKIEKMKNKKDLDKLLRSLFAKPHFNNDVMSFSMKFQACDDIETKKIEDQIIELKLNVNEN